MEYWNIGILEYWNIGMMENGRMHKNTTRISMILGIKE